MGAWSAVWGALSGGNDRDLAEMLSEYGASLETTQSVVQPGPGHTVKPSARSRARLSSRSSAVCAPGNGS